jgi:hypothetical protein
MDLPTHALRAGTDAPARESAPAIDGGAQNEQADCAAERERRDKAIATPRARAALAGFEMHVIANDAGRAVFLLTRWNLTRELADLAAVQVFLDQVGAHHE